MASSQPLRMLMVVAHSHNFARISDTCGKHVDRGDQVTIVSKAASSRRTSKGPHIPALAGARFQRMTTPPAGSAATELVSHLQLRVAVMMVPSARATLLG